MKALFFNIGNQSLSEKIATTFQSELSPMDVGKFPDGEIYVRPLVGVEDQNTFIVSSTINDSVNDSLLSLLIAIDSLKRSRANSVNVIIPYFYYSRQDKRVNMGDSIVSRLVANLIEKAGASRVFLVELHALQIEGFFSIPSSHINTIRYMGRYLFENKKLNLDKLAIVSPDMGGFKRAKELQGILGGSIIAFDKSRDSSNNVEVKEMMGDPKGLDCLVVDDVISSGKTILSVANKLIENGANSVSVMVTHGLFSGDFLSRCKLANRDGVISRLFISDTIELKKPEDFIEVISISSLICEEISNREIM